MLVYLHLLTEDDLFAFSSENSPSQQWRWYSDICLPLSGPMSAAMKAGLSWAWRLNPRGLMIVGKEEGEKAMNGGRRNAACRVFAWIVTVKGQIRDFASLSSVSPTQGCSNPTVMSTVFWDPPQRLAIPRVSQIFNS